MEDSTTLALGVLEGLIDEPINLETQRERATLRTKNSLFSIAEIEMGLQIFGYNNDLRTKLNQDFLKVCLEIAPRAEQMGAETNPEVFRLSVKKDLERILDSEVTKILMWHLNIPSTYEALSFRFLLNI